MVVEQSNRDGRCKQSGYQGEGGLLTVTSNASSQPSLAIQGLSGDLVFRPNSPQLSVVAGKSVSDSVSVISYGYIPKLTAQIACSGAPAKQVPSFQDRLWDLADPPALEVPVGVSVSRDSYELP